MQIGGATAKIGDPTGRLVSRGDKPSYEHEANLTSMHTQMEKIWTNVEAYARRHGYESDSSWRRELLDNASWINKLGVVEFLRLMGSGMRMGAMLARDTVKNKMEKGDGMSFAEFTYPLLQAWDWWHLYNNKGVQIQIGGGDQYGNIVAGVDGVKHIIKNHSSIARASGMNDVKHMPMGFTVPLLTTPSGEKFGKSAGNAVWLDKEMTSTFDLYGFLLRSSDAAVERYLKLFTFLPTSQITAVMSEHNESPNQRVAQHLLAKEVLELVHGAEEALGTEKQHRGMRRSTSASNAAASSGAPADGARSDGLPQTDSIARQTKYNSLPPARTSLPISLVRDHPFSRVLYHADMVASKTEGARLISKGGAYVGSPQGSVSDEVIFTSITKDLEEGQKAEDFITDDNLLILRLGKWKVRVCEIVSDEEFERRKTNAPG
ncbi:tyrosyl-tRNA synthetase [Elasticomyces elasticus]|nr:tyrosyl-tRNA synthetase [Elasticomyces elasticus]